VEGAIVANLWPEVASARAELTAADSGRYLPHGVVGPIQPVIDELDVFDPDNIIIVPYGFPNEILRVLREYGPSASHSLQGLVFQSLRWQNNLETVVFQRRLERAEVFIQDDSEVALLKEFDPVFGIRSYGVV
jgi:hypothetical protein